MATTKKKTGNGAGEAAQYEWKFTTGARVRFDKDTHNYDIDKKFRGKEGEVTNAQVSGDGNPDACVLFDGGGSVWIHADDLVVVRAAGTERPLEEPGDHETASVQTGAELPKLPTDRFEMGTVSRDCPVPIAPEVLREKSVRLASIQQDIDALEAKLDAAKTQHKDLVGGLNGERRALEGEVRDGTEMKPVTCKWIGDPRDMSKKLVRTDMDENEKGAVVESHNLQVHELQMAFEDSDDDEPDSDDPEPVLTGSDDGDGASASAH